MQCMAQLCVGLGEEKYPDCSLLNVLKVSTEGSKTSPVIRVDMGFGVIFSPITGILLEYF